VSRGENKECGEQRTSIHSPHLHTHTHTPTHTHTQRDTHTKRHTPTKHIHTHTNTPPPTHTHTHTHTKPHTNQKTNKNVRRQTDESADRRRGINRLRDTGGVTEIGQLSDEPDCLAKP